MIKELFQSLAEAIGNLFTRLVDYASHVAFNMFVKDKSRRDDILHEIQDESFVKSINPDNFKTEFMKNKVLEIKERAKTHNSNIIEWLDSLLLPFLGKAVPDVIFQDLGLDKEKMPKQIKNLIGLMDLISDMGVLASEIDVVSTAVSFTLFREIGSFFDRIINYSGLGTLTGYGFGTAFGSAITPVLTYAINEQLLPIKLDMQTVSNGYGRFKVTPTALKEHMKYAGLNPDTELPLPEDETKLGYGVWYKTEDIINYPFDPSKWTLEPVKTYGDLIMRLAEDPVSYFILNNVATSGFYDRELFKRALVDSSYSPLAMSLILRGAEASFIKRHITAYEDEINDMYLNGELDFNEYKKNLSEIYPSEDMVNVISSFFKDKWIRTRRVGVKNLVESMYKKGVLDKNDAKVKLLNAGYRAWIVDDYLDLWDMEKQEGKDFTETQLCNIAKKGIWTYEEVFKRLVNKGWTAEESKAWLKMYIPSDQWDKIDSLST